MGLRNVAALAAHGARKRKWGCLGMSCILCGRMGQFEKPEQGHCRSATDRGEWLENVSHVEYIKARRLNPHWPGSDPERRTPQKPSPARLQTHM